MKSLLLLVIGITLAGAADPAKPVRNPADHLPGHIRRVTWFGERADWSPDARKILFIEKTYGDAYELEVASGILKPVTHHFHHGGFVRALYLANGDILLSGSTSFDAEKPHLNRTEKAELWVLDKSLKKKPVRLGEKCSEGPAVSRKNLRIAWTQVHSQYPDKLKQGEAQMWVGELVYDNGEPRIANKKLILSNASLPFKTGLETQNFRPSAEEELIFSAYGYDGTEVMGIRLNGEGLVNYSKAPKQYDEPEGIFPDGKHTLVECDNHNLKGWQHIDIYKLALDGSGKVQRLTHFNEFPGFKASNPVVSDDGRWMAFQMARTDEPAGVGHGIFIYDLTQAGVEK